MSIGFHQGQNSSLPRPGEIKAALANKLTQAEMDAMPAISKRLQDAGVLSFMAARLTGISHKGGKSWKKGTT